MQEQASRRRFCNTTLEKHECILAIRCQQQSPCTLLFCSVTWSRCSLVPCCCLEKNSGLSGASLIVLCKDVYCHCSSSSWENFLFSPVKWNFLKMMKQTSSSAHKKRRRQLCNTYANSQAPIHRLWSISRLLNYYILFPSWAPTGESWKILISLFTVRLILKYDTFIQEKKYWSLHTFTAVLSLYITITN